MIRADLHLHTHHSPDGSISPKTVVRQLYAHPTIKAVAVTDHNTLRGYLRVKELAKPYPDLVIIPGVELDAVEGHILLLGITHLPPKPWTIKNIIKYTREQGGISVAPHPYRLPGIGDSALDYDLDAIEVLNGVSSPELNKRGKRLNKIMDLPGLAGSDAHRPDELWTVYTELEASPTVRDILEAIQKGKLIVAHSRKSIPF